MADISHSPNPLSSASHPPPPPGTMAAPPPPGVDGKSHLPPQPPSLTIPQGYAAVPSSMMSPPSTGGGAWGPGGPTRSSQPANNRTLYVGNLQHDVTQSQLQEVFQTVVEGRGSVSSVKIIPDKNATQRGLNYGFVELNDPSVAEFAMLSLNGRKMAGQDIKINWAYMSNKDPAKEDTSSHYHVFVGDLGQTVTDESLFQAFQQFGDCSEARVMWDHKTNRTRGYGFVAFRSYEGAQRALKMDGEYVGDRPIRVNWANQKGQPSMNQRAAMEVMGMAPSPGGPMYAQGFGHAAQQDQGRSYDKSSASTTTIYVGNLAPHTTGTDLHPLFANYGAIREIRAQPDRGYAFVKYEDKNSATAAIQALNDYAFNGRNLKVAWGKDRTPSAANRGGQGPPQSAGSIPPQSPFSAQPQHDPYSAMGYGLQSAGPLSAISPHSANPYAYGLPQAAHHQHHASTPISAVPHTPGGAYGGYSSHHASHPSQSAGYGANGNHAPPSAGGYVHRDSYGGHQQQQYGQMPTAYGQQSSGASYGSQSYGAGGYGGGAQQQHQHHQQQPSTYSAGGNYGSSAGGYGQQSYGGYQGQGGGYGH